jgi:hypothetical protein
MPSPDYQYKPPVLQNGDCRKYLSRIGFLPPEIDAAQNTRKLLCVNSQFSKAVSGFRPANVVFTCAGTAIILICRFNNVFVANR